MTGGKAFLKRNNYLATAMLLAVGVSSALSLPALADDQAYSPSSSFSSDPDSGSLVGGSAGGIFGTPPLAGGVTVFDHVKPGGMRLSRATAPTVPADLRGAARDRPANNHEIPLSGGLVDSNSSFQSLFPSIDRASPTPKVTPSLAGSAQQSDAKHPHYIWQKSPVGGYYDASGNTHDVVKGNKLYLYGGTMADGLTPAPGGPVEQNSMGYIRWQPITGGPAGWY